MYKDKPIIKCATLDDYKKCLPLLRMLYKGDVGPNLRRVLRHLIKDGDGCILMVERDWRVLGVLVGSYHLDIDWEGRIGKIDALYVEKDFRRKGLGRDLCKFFLSKARRNGCNRFYSNWNR